MNNKYLSYDEPTVINALNVINDLEQILTSHPNFLDDYKKIKENYSKKLLSVSKNYSAYGILMPEVDFLLGFVSTMEKDMLTNGEIQKKFAYYTYYYDENDKLLMIEHFIDGDLCYIYLYYNSVNQYDIIVYKNQNRVANIRRILYKEGSPIKYLDYHCRNIELVKLDPHYNVTRLDTYYMYEDKVVFNMKVLNSINVWNIEKTTYKRKLSALTDNNINSMLNADSNNGDIKKTIYISMVASINRIQTDNIYAFSLYVEDDCEPTRPTVTFGFNTNEQLEISMQSAYEQAEAKWNYAYWLQNELFIFGKEDTAQTVKNWIDKKHLLDEIDDYEETPKVTKAFVNELVKVVKELHKEKVLTNKFGKELPIIIHELEYYPQIAEQNIKANGKRLLGDFLDFCPLE